MTLDYRAIAAQASQLLASAGANAVLVRVSQRPYDPATGAAEAVEHRYAVTAASFGYRAREIDGTFVQVGDRRVLMTADVKPAVGDLIEFAGATLRAVSVEAVAPAGVAVIYKVQARGVE